MSISAVLTSLFQIQLVKNLSLKHYFWIFNGSLANFMIGILYLDYTCRQVLKHSPYRQARIQATVSINVPMNHNLNAH